MSNEPSLPNLPAVFRDERPPRFNPRKRVRDVRGNSSSPSFNSSDPAVFSSDDDPGIDNYVEGRRKKRYVGSWFQQHLASSDSTFSDGVVMAPKPARRTLARQVDSGVFLGSDETDSDDAMEDLDVPVRPRLPQLENGRVTRVSQAELTARDRIRVCVEQGNETIDLWSLGLEEVSDETVSPLANLSCIPVVTKDVAFEHKEPELKMYLAMNRLRRIPGALLDLGHLSILSLRGNKLTELPPGIAKLRSLKHLNVSQNRLKYVPAELLDLLAPTSSLRDLVLHPNPLYEPDQAFGRDEAGERDLAGEDPTPLPRFLTRYLGRSPLQLSDSRGQVLSDFQFPSGETARRIAVKAPGGARPSCSQGEARPSAVPSLVEASLRSCYSSAQLPNLQHYMPDDLAHLGQLLDRAARQKETGGLGCSRCRRLLVVPAVEWVEWREVSTCEAAADAPGPGTVGPGTVRPLSLAEDERAVPFLHRGCSWRCGPAQ